MSCSVMRCHVSPPPRPFPPASPKRRPSAVLHVVPPSRFVPFALPPACLRRVPVFARIACARAPAFAPARFARLIALARAKRRAHVSRPFRWGFFAPARGERRSGLADAASSCLILPRFYRGQAFTRNHFKIREQTAASPPSRRGRGKACHSFRQSRCRASRPAPSPNLSPQAGLPDAHISFRSAPVGPAMPRSAPIRHPREGGGPSMAPDAAATGGEQGEPPAAAAKTKAGPRLGGRGDGRGHAIQSQRKQMCESGRQAGRGLPGRRLPARYPAAFDAFACSKWRTALSNLSRQPVLQNPTT